MASLIAAQKNLRQWREFLEPHNLALGDIKTDPRRVGDCA